MDSLRSSCVCVGHNTCPVMDAPKLLNNHPIALNHASIRATVFYGTYISVAYIKCRMLACVSFISFVFYMKTSIVKQKHIRTWIDKVNRDHSRCGLSQPETTLQCNIACHWLNPYPKWSLQLYQTKYYMHYQFGNKTPSIGWCRLQCFPINVRTVVRRCGGQQYIYSQKIYHCPNAIVPALRSKDKFYESHEPAKSDNNATT